MERQGRRTHTGIEGGRGVVAELGGIHPCAEVNLPISALSAHTIMVSIVHRPAPHPVLCTPTDRRPRRGESDG